LTWSVLGKYVEWSGEKDLITATTDRAMVAVDGKQEYLPVMISRRVLYIASLIAEDYGEALSNGIEYTRLLAGLPVLHEAAKDKWAIGEPIDIEAVLRERVNEVRKTWPVSALFFVFEPLLMALLSSRQPKVLDSLGLANIARRTIGVEAEIAEGLEWLELAASAALGDEDATRTISAHISDNTALSPSIQRFPLIVGSGLVTLWPVVVLSCQGSLFEIAMSLSGQIWDTMFYRTVANYWHRFATERPFAFLNPRISAPAIKEQAEELPTTKSCAQLLLLAADAIGRPFPPEMFSYIREAAAEQSAKK